MKNEIFNVSPAIGFNGILAVNFLEKEREMGKTKPFLRVKMSNHHFLFIPYAADIEVERLRLQIQMQCPGFYSEDIEKLVQAAIAIPIPIVVRRVARRSLDDKTIMWHYHIVNPQA